MRTFIPGIAAAMLMSFFCLGNASADTPSSASNLLDSVVHQLETSLDENSPYPARDALPKIEIVSAAVAQGRIGHHTGSGGILRGLYDPEREVISLVAPWSPERPEDLSVLLHELAHHRQKTAQHWYCDGAQELPAYRLQAQWLDDHDAVLSINWLAAVLQSTCSRRDHHPG